MRRSASLTSMYIARNNELSDAARIIARDTQLGEFVLFGGFPIDSLSGRAAQAERNDIDIAVQGLSDTLLTGFENVSAENGYAILCARRPYTILRRIDVLTTYIRKGLLTIDANFMAARPTLGLFNIDSLYITFPAMDVVDSHGCLQGLKEGHIRPIRDLSEENAFLTSARLIYLAAKYGIDLTGPRHADTVSRLAGLLLAETPPPGWQFNSFLSSVLKSLLKSRSRGVFLEELRRTGLLSPWLPELESAARHPSVSAGLAKAGSVSELAHFFISCLPASQQLSLREKLLPLTQRVWETTTRKLALDGPDRI